MKDLRLKLTGLHTEFCLVKMRADQIKALNDFAVEKKMSVEEVWYNDYPWYDKADEPIFSRPWNDRKPIFRVQKGMICLNKSDITLLIKDMEIQVDGKAVEFDRNAVKIDTEQKLALRDKIAADEYAIFCGDWGERNDILMRIDPKATALQKMDTFDAAALKLYFLNFGKYGYILKSADYAGLEFQYPNKMPGKFDYFALSFGKQTQQLSIEEVLEG